MRKDQPRGRITTKVTAWTENGSDALWCLRSRVSISSSALQGWVDKPLTKLRSGVKGRYGPLTPGVCNSSAGQAISLQPPLLFAGALAPPWICPGTHILQSLRDCKNLKTGKNLRGDSISPPWPPWISKAHSVWFVKFQNKTFLFWAFWESGVIYGSRIMNTEMHCILNKMSSGLQVPC